MSNTRLTWADSLKGYLMLLVVVGHAIQSVMRAECENNHVWNMIYSFHMPAFVAVSGWLAYRPLSKQENIIKIVNRRTRQLLVPYLFWSIISFFKKNIFSLESLSNIIIRPDNYFWFLWSLYFINILFLIGKYFAKKIHLNELLIFVFVSIALLLLMLLGDIRILGIQFIGYYFLFYIFGYYIHRFPIKLKYHFYFLLFGIWGGLAWNWNMHALPSFFPETSHFINVLLQYAYRGMSAIIAIIILIYLGPKYMENGVINRYMSKFGQISLGVYVIHLSLMGCIIRAIKFVNPDSSQLGLIIAGILCSIVISYTLILLIQCSKKLTQVLLGKI